MDVSTVHVVLKDTLLISVLCDIFFKKQSNLLQNDVLVAACIVKLCRRIVSSEGCQAPMSGIKFAYGNSVAPFERLLNNTSDKLFVHSDIKNFVGKVRSITNISCQSVGALNFRIKSAVSCMLTQQASVQPSGKVVIES
jgi:hypothetical protein